MCISYLRNCNLKAKWKTFDPETCQNSWQLWGPDATYGTGDEVNFLFVVVVIVVCFLVVCGVYVVVVVITEVKSLFVVFFEQQDFLEITAGLDSGYQVVCCGNTQSITWLRTKVCFVYSANKKVKFMFCLPLQIFTVLSTLNVYCRRPAPLTWHTMWALRWIILNIYWFEVFLLVGIGKKLCALNADLTDPHFPFPRASIATLKSSAPTWQNTCKRHCFDKNVNFDKKVCLLA